MAGKDSPYLAGMIWRKDVDDAYQKELSRQQLTSDLATKLTLNNSSEDVHFLEGYIITEIDVPKAFIGKTIKDLNIRSVYGVDILSIKRPIQNSTDIKAIPEANHKFEQNEKIIVAGEAEKINLIKTI
jgi:CIC family chloride channel protein